MISLLKSRKTRTEAYRKNNNNRYIAKNKGYKQLEYINGEKGECDIEGTEREERRRKGKRERERETE